ncbi:ligand-gated channel protein [Candidatus Williamhamiltonella defendens]|uniref:TonB-dependent hemin receptor n=1 Tax=Hamiltonella defensa subsp. Acyrthosiphon pisum (strain 5AT) TaxID=572265 RepID=C4K801_HAMD5|nr:TonB-dependent hemoglobin/transferrin/lactoferrin family receptor [Candidatus Hamiltonella defensa]ACQ68694.1 TonB-dependent hemin receptor [Candidatus Hamiltonella defensa 5AT (Acyrthosiphon pisum)]ATW23227.1 ligand-gated channel protein [Candidatus Hamiltonella defensa]
MSFTLPKLLRLSSLTLAISLPSLAYAESGMPDKIETEEKKPSFNKQSLKTETITVTATGNPRDTFSTPMMITVIDRDNAKSDTASSAADILLSTPGITIEGVGRKNGQDVNMRGYGGKGILTLIDGVRQNLDTGHMSGHFIDPSFIKQVEIVRGPSALLYGSGALGGVISYQTVDTVDLLQPGRNSGYRVFSMGATGDRSLGIGATVFGKTDDLDGLITFSVRDVGNIKESDGINAPNDEGIRNLMAKGTWKIDDSQSLSANVRYYRNNAEEILNPQEVNPSLRNPMTDRKTVQKDVQFSYALNPKTSDWLDAKTTLYYSDVSIDDKVKKRADQGRTQKTLGTKLENRSRLLTHSPAAHLLTYGTEFYQQKQKPEGHAKAFPDAKTNFASGWVQDEITFRDLPVSLLIGTRFDRYKAKNPKNADISADNWSSRGAVTLTPTDWLMLFASYGQAFRAPTMGEMYNDAQHFRGNRFKPNPNLKPEKNATQEYGFGVKFDDLVLTEDSVEFKASYFSTQATDYITTEVNFRKGTTQYVNVPDTNIWGWDAVLNYKTPWFGWNLAYNRTHGKNEKTGLYISSINPDTLTSSLDIPIPKKDLSAGWVMTLAESTDFMKSPGTTHSQEIKAQPGYAVHDFYLSYKGQNQFQGVTTNLVLANAFDKEYYSPQGVPQLGRTAKLLISYQW